jgi:hypothetical protein
VAAAAETIGALQTYAAIAGAEGGEWKVRGNESIYALHDREAVMPASIADPMRNFFSGKATMNDNSSRGGDTSYDGGDSHSHTWHIHNAANFERVLHDFGARRQFEGYVKNALRNAGRRVR